MRLKVLCSAAFMAGAGVASSASAETMIFATDMTPTHFVTLQGLEPLMACIKERTNNAIDFNYMPAGQLAKRNEMVDAINKGMAQFAYSSLPDEAANLPLQGVTSLPGLHSTALQGTIAYRKALDAGGALAQELEKANVKPVMAFLLAPYQIMGKEQLDDVSKWEGKIIRATGSGMIVLANAVGATAVQMPTTDVFVAMQRGTIDGLILSFASVKPYSVDEVAQYYSSNLSLGTVAAMEGMDLKLYNSLPADQQKAIDECGREAEVKLATWVDENEGKLRDALAAEGKVIFEVGPEQLKGFAEKMAPVESEFVTRLADRGLPAQQALDEYKAALEATPAN